MFSVTDGFLCGGWSGGGEEKRGRKRVRRSKNEEIERERKRLIFQTFI